MKSQKFKDIAGLLAALFLAITCLVAAVYHIQVILDLKQHGISTAANVVNIKRGARNSSWGVYQYVANNGQQIIAQDQFQQYIKQVHKGETIRVLYHRQDVKRVTADHGTWIWQGPAIFLGGFLLLAGLTILIWRHRSA